MIRSMYHQWWSSFHFINFLLRSIFIFFSLFFFISNFEWNANFLYLLFQKAIKKKILKIKKKLENNERAAMCLKVYVIKFPNNQSNEWSLSKWIFIAKKYFWISFSGFLCFNFHSASNQNRKEKKIIPERSTTLANTLCIFSAEHCNDS